MEERFLEYNISNFEQILIKSVKIPII